VLQLVKLPQPLALLALLAQLLALLQPLAVPRLPAQLLPAQALPLAGLAPRVRLLVQQQAHPGQAQLPVGSCRRCTAPNHTAHTAVCWARRLPRRSSQGWRARQEPPVP
jgi:hypothetical protein